MNLQDIKKLIEKVNDDIQWWLEDMARRIDNEEYGAICQKVIDDKGIILNRLIVKKHELKRTAKSNS